MKQPIDLEGICGELRKTANAVYLACPAPVADDIAYKLLNAASEIERLQGLVDGAVGEREYLLEQWKGFLMDTDQYCEECAHHKTPQCLPECEWGKLWQWRGFSEREGG